MTVIILTLLALLLSAAPAASQEGLAVVSAASYIAPGSIAPDSWAAAYGVNIAREIVYGEIGDDGQFPTEVAGVTIKVNGELARIHFVSPGQANFLVPRATVSGLASVVLDSGSAGQLSGEVQVLEASPGLFARNAQGFGPGSIQNGVTYKEAPFEVETPEIPGLDKRTRLAIYGTGFRFAETLQAVLTVPAGQRYELGLEYFGPAGGNFGLDQANVVLPAELDAEVDVSVELRTPDYRSNQVTFRMKPLPANQIQLQELLLDQDEILGGEPLQGTIRLNGRAPIGGTTVQLDYSSPLASGPASVIVAEGEVEARFTIRTAAPNQIQTVEIRARAGSVDLRKPLTIYPRNATVLDRVFVDPEIVLGGKEAVGTVRLRDITPSTISVALSSSDSNIALVPATVTIFTGNVSAEFRIRTAQVNARQEITIGASIEGSQASSVLSVRPAVEISVRSQSVVGGTPVDIEVELAEPAPVTGALVELRSTSLNVDIPRNLTVPVEQRTATVRVNTLRVLSGETVTLSALYGNVLAQTGLTLQPSASITLESLTLNPTAVKGGSLVTGTVRLTAAAPITGVFVDLKNDNGLAIFRMPFNVTVPSGQESANFTIETATVVFVENVTITATVGSVTKTANLTVNP